MTETLDVLVAERPGTSVNVAYNDREPIFFLMLRVSHKLKEKDDEILERRLYMNGILLQDIEESIPRCRVFGNVLTYKSRIRRRRAMYIQSDTPMKVFVKTITGKTHTLYFCNSDTVGAVKKAVHDVGGMAPDLQMLSFSGIQLEDEKALGEYNIQTESTLVQVLRLLGGVGPYLPGIMFTDVSDTEGVQKVKLSTSGPPWWYVSYGTNVECNCKCLPDQRVICRMDRGMVELSSSPFECPNCRSCEVVPVTVGFVSCKYRFHGIKSTGERYTSEWEDVPDDGYYHRFKSSNQIFWRRLVIESAELGSPESCAICLKSMLESTTLDCGHQFHQGCYARWNSCPNCRLNQQLVTGRH
ncbi:hypothetical protein B0O80DRAFT_526265 [Mortierella sp. GBAus27b]|nr:hypothetical protein B0O80DRAFT_526265 [Mortierella sp. GBAus27b]